MRICGSEWEHCIVMPQIDICVVNIPPWPPGAALLPPQPGRASPDCNRLSWPRVAVEQYLPRVAVEQHLSTGFWPGGDSAAIGCGQAGQGEPRQRAQ